MKNHSFYCLTAVMVLVNGLVFTNAQVPKSGTLKPVQVEAPKSLPFSLDNLYPPKVEKPVYQIQMFQLNAPFTAIVVDLFENDLQNVTADFDAFKAQYAKIAKLLPEWEVNFPAQPINDLGAALQTGDQAKVMDAYAKVGKVCFDCHLTYMPTVQHKYYWGDFLAIKVTDPLTKQVIDFSKFMQYLGVSFTGISVDATQGQIDNAKRQLQGFRARFQALEETCMNCHDTERHYFVDASVKEMIDKLDVALNASPVVPQEIAKYMQAIGSENCGKCHLVHVPAAVDQRHFNK